MKKYPPENAELAKTGWNPEPGNLVPYYLTGKNTIELYNNVQYAIPESGSDSTADSFEITGLPKE